jgi:hypothetical protein
MKGMHNELQPARRTSFAAQRILIVGAILSAGRPAPHPYLPPGLIFIR